MEGSKRRTYPRAFIEDALSLTSLFVSVSFCHIRRTANCVAHERAKYALSIGGERIWLEEEPSCIATLVEDGKSCTADDFV